MRVDELSAQKLRESHDTIQRLTSQLQQMQENMHSMNDSREFQDFQSICSGKLSHVPSQPAIVPCPRSMLSRDRSMPLDTWNLSGTQGNVFFGNPRLMFDSSQTRCQGILHSIIKMLQVESQCREVQGDLSRKAKNELGAQFRCRCLQEGRQP